MNVDVIHTWNYRGCTCRIKHLSYHAHQIDRLRGLFIQTDWYCGYVAMPFDVNADAVSVYGGVTYKEVGNNPHFMIYGFDCNHCGSVNHAYTRDMKWLIKEVEQMTDQLLALAGAE